MERDAGRRVTELAAALTDVERESIRALADRIIATLERLSAEARQRALAYGRESEVAP